MLNIKITLDWICHRTTRERNWGKEDESDATVWRTADSLRGSFPAAELTGILRALGILCQHYLLVTHSHSNLLHNTSSFLSFSSTAGCCVRPWLKTISTMINWSPHSTPMHMLVLGRNQDALRWCMPFNHQQHQNKLPLPPQISHWKRKDEEKEERRRKRKENVKRKKRRRQKTRWQWQQQCWGRGRRRQG